MAEFDALGLAYQCRAGVLVEKLVRILQQQHRACCDLEACARRAEMPAKDVFHAHPFIGKEPIGRFGFRLVLACHRKALVHAASHLD